jgi:hypothetical protein
VGVGRKNKKKPSKSFNYLEIADTLALRLDIATLRHKKDFAKN